MDEFEIDPDEIAVPDDIKAEPVLVCGPYLVEFDDAAPLDVGRAAGEPDEWDEYPPSPAGVRSGGLAGSLGVHLVPLVMLLVLTSSAPAGLGGAIPVQFVLQRSLPEVEAPAEQVSAPPSEPAVSIPEPPKPIEPPPKMQQAAVIPPPPRPALPKRAPASRQAVTKPGAASAKPADTPQPPKAAPPQPASPSGLNSTGPYLAYLVTLTRQHLDILPQSLIAGRRGKTVIGVRVLDDGTIAGTRVAASSSYPEIDARIQEMVVAVRRFPPLPEALRGQNIELNLNLNFPEVFKQ